MEGTQLERTQVSQKVGIKIGQLHNVKDYSVIAILFFGVQVIDILLVCKLITWASFIAC